MKYDGLSQFPAVLYSTGKELSQGIPGGSIILLQPVSDQPWSGNTLAHLEKKF
jgi:hypothetical protein